MKVGAQKWTGAQRMREWKVSERSGVRFPLVPNMIWRERERERERERPENVLVFGPAGWFQNCFACCAADAMANGCQSILRVNRPATATTSRHDRVASSTSPVSRPLVLSAQAPPPKKRETQEKRKYPTTNFPGNVVLCTILTRSRSPNRESMIDLLCRLQSTQFGRMS